MAEDVSSDSYQQSHSKWMVFWTAIGALAAAGGVVAAVYFGAHNGGNSSIPLSPTDTQNSQPLDPQKSPNGSEFTHEEEILFERVKTHVSACDAVPSNQRVPYADAELSCTVSDKRPDSPIHVASFATTAGLNGFMSSENAEEEAAKNGGDNFATSHQWSFKGATIGDVIRYNKDGRAHLSWSFTNDAFHDTYAKSFVVMAEGDDPDSLWGWWNTLPI
jgi:hypothetical protein